MQLVGLLLVAVTATAEVVVVVVKPDISEGFGLLAYIV
jgi:hypothetical protein